MNDCKPMRGAQIEVGRVTAIDEDGITVENMTRRGIVTLPLSRLCAVSPVIGDTVYFFMFDDGHGAVLGEA